MRVLIQSIGIIRLFLAVLSRARQVGRLVFAGHRLLVAMRFASPPERLGNLGGAGHGICDGGNDK